MKLFADHSVGHTNLVFAESIHEAIQSRMVINGEPSIPLLSEITRDEPIRFSLLSKEDKKTVIQSFIACEKRHARIIFNKDIEISIMEIEGFFIEYDPMVWYNDSQPEGEEFMVSTISKGVYTSFGEAIRDFIFFKNNLK